jgi:hypothetical protein
MSNWMSRFVGTVRGDPDAMGLRRRPAGLATTRVTNQIVDYLRRFPRSGNQFINHGGRQYLSAARVDSREGLGRYSGTLIECYDTDDGDGDLSIDDIGVLGDSSDCEIWNLEELTGGPRLAVNSIVAGMFGPETGDSHTPVILVSGGGSSGQMFAVKVSNPSGSNGTTTTAANYTYTVKDLAGNTIGTGVALSRPRPNGAVTTQSDGYGVAFYDGTTLKLWDAGEIPQTATCE